MRDFVFKPGGKELAKVLHYYNLLEGDLDFKIVCPFHKDEEPSLMVNLNEGVFYCFGCSLSGDAFTFVKLANNKLDDLKSMQLYYKILKSKKVKQIKYKSFTKPQKAPDKQLLIYAMDYYFNLKKVNWEASESPEKLYLKRRGFSPKVLNKCEAKITYNDCYPIIFPMFDMDIFKGYVCRTTNERIEKKRKYLYNEGFSRKDTLVGDYNSNTVVLVEGYMDRLKLIQFGVKINVVAILGWKITAQQVSKLKSEGVTHIISALDNDKTGIKGTDYLKQFFKVKRVKFPEGVNDPGDLNKKKFKQIKEVFSNGKGKKDS